MVKHTIRKLYDASDFASVKSQEIIELWDSRDNIIDWEVDNDQSCDVTRRVNEELLASGAALGEKVLIRLYW